MSSQYNNMDRGEREVSLLSKTAQLMNDEGLSIDEIIDRLESEDSRDLIETAMIADNESSPYEKFENGDGHDFDAGYEKYYVAGLTNLRNMWNIKFHITSMIGFLNRVVDQYRVNEKLSSASDQSDDHCEDNERLPTDEAKQHVRDFLQSVFGFNPDKHVDIAQDVIKSGDVERRIGVIDSIPKDMVAQVPSRNLIRNFERYMERFYEQLRMVTKLLYSDDPGLEDALIIYDSFQSKEQADEFCKTNSDKFIAPVLTLRHRLWTCHAPFSENKRNTTAYSKDCPIMYQLLEKQHKDDLLIQDFTRTKAAKASKRSMKDLSEEEKEKFKEYKRFVDGMKGATELTKESMNEIEEKKKWLAEKAADLYCPEDGIIVPIIELDGKQTKRKVLYTKAETQDETIARTKTDNPELYKILVEEQKIRDTGILPSGKKIESRKKKG